MGCRELVGVCVKKVVVRKCSEIPNEIMILIADYIVLPEIRPIHDTGERERLGKVLLARNSAR